MPRKKNSEPTYVTGAKGAYELAVPITHPAYCVCKVCPRHRAANDWEREIVIRARRKSPYPESYLDSVGAARDVKRREEQQLREAVDEAARQKKARAGQTTLEEVCETYAAHQQKEGKRYDRDQYVITAIEEHFGSERDPEQITKADYREWCGSMEKEKLSPATILRRTNTLLAILNFARKRDLIRDHQLVGVERPKSKKKTKPVVFTKRQVALLLGKAMDRYEIEQAKWNASLSTAKQKKQSSLAPLRGFCLIAYYTLMRPENNFALEWSRLSIDEKEDRGRFHLIDHKNSSKGIEVEGALHAQLVKYLRPLMPHDRKGLVHPNPATGEPYTHIRKQWPRLIEIANELLGPNEQLTGVRTHFYTWRHTGASHLAEIGADPVMIARMMGDTSLKTILDHYFDSSVEHMQEIMQKWIAPPSADHHQEGVETWTN